MTRSKAQKEAQRKYQKSLICITIRLPRTKYGKLLDYINSKSSKRRWMIEAFEEKMERECSLDE